MKVRHLLQVLLVFAAVLSSVSSAQFVPAPVAAAQVYGQPPLTFEAYQGQANGQVEYFPGGSNDPVFLASRWMVPAPAPATIQQEGATVPVATPHKLVQVSARQVKQAVRAISIALLGASTNAVEENTHPHHG
jgi:hypothetical protein